MPEQTSRERIRAAVDAWTVDKARDGNPTGLAPEELTDLADRIDEALFGPPPGPWVGPLLTAVELGEITGPHRGCERVVLGPGQRPCSVLRLARHIDAQSATIRNQNEITVDLRDRLEAAATELGRAKESLREKNEIIKAYAGPTGMTPEDVAFALAGG